MLNMDELKKINKKREKFKLEPYKKILEMINFKIKEASTILNQNYCIYQIPEFILGYSLYDIDECCNWLKERILKAGIEKVEILEKNIMVIKWSY